MRKSKNYYKFMEYMAFGISGWHDDAVMVDNGVIECVAYPKVAHIEDYSKLYKCNYDKMTMDSENTWLTIKCVLVNEEVIDVYYVTNECNLYIGQLILDDYRTQKQALDAIHKKVVCYAKNLRKTSFYGMFGGFPTITEMRNNPCFCCPADRQGNRCGGEQWCKETWKRYEAIINPEWHHVNLNTLANLDFDMLDEKRQRYFTVYRELQETLTRLRKCKTLESYDNCLTRLMRRKNVMWARGEVSNAMWHFIEVKLSMQNVESGIWGSYNEKSTGYHKSRRYNKSRA